MRLSLVTKWLASSFFLLAACAAPVKYERPPVELPAAWQETAPRFVPDGSWWRVYDDPALDKLVDEARMKNSDLLVAAARIDEARALLAEQQSFFFPRVDAQASAARSRISQRNATSFPGIPTEFPQYRAGLNV